MTIERRRVEQDPGELFVPLVLVGRAGGDLDEDDIRHTPSLGIT
jgi:hypothetical protein